MSINNNTLIRHLKQLPVFCTALHIGAHPDDEDSGLLAYLVNKYGIRTIYWSGTRGEKGQNAINQYKDDALGVYRVWESLDAAQVIGSECYFGPLIDFGFSKAGIDALKIWNHLNSEQSIEWNDEIVCKSLVVLIRHLKPSLIISRWQGHAGDFHGHHQAVGIAAPKAIQFAADPNYYPELIEHGLYPWQVQKHYTSQDNSGGRQDFGGALNLCGLKNNQLVEEGCLEINTGEIDYYLQASYQELAWQAYSKHRTQAMALTPVSGNFYYYLKNIIEEKANDSLLTGIDLSLFGLLQKMECNNDILVAHALEFDKLCSRIDITDFIIAKDEVVINTLTALKKQILLMNKVLTSAVFNQAQQQTIRQFLAEKNGLLNKIAALISGLTIDSFSSRIRVNPSSSVESSLLIWKKRPIPIKNVRVEFMHDTSIHVTESDTAHQSLIHHTPQANNDLLLRKDYRIDIQPHSTFTTPYWLQKKESDYYYGKDIKNMLQDKDVDYPIKIIVHYEINGQTFQSQKTLACKDINNRKIHRTLPIQIVPSVSVSPVSLFYFFNTNIKKHKLQIEVIISKLTGHGDDVGKVWLESNHEISIEPENKTINLNAENHFEKVSFTVYGDALHDHKSHQLTAHFTTEKTDYTHNINPVYKGPDGMITPSLPNKDFCTREAYIFNQAIINLITTNVKITNHLKYAFIEGEYSNYIQLMQQRGFDVSLIGIEYLNNCDLDEFDVLILGHRAYFHNPKLFDYNKMLLDYCAKGGVIICHYQHYDYAKRNAAPYPVSFSMPHDRVTKADAPITILDKKDLLFHYPNKITLRDFDNWKYDRGMYFFNSWDENFKPLLASNDPNEPSQEGGLLRCNYGKGAYIYLGYSLIAQINRGVEGALKLYANILATPVTQNRIKLKLLKKINFFSQLKNEHLSRIASELEAINLEKGEVLINQGDIGKELFILIKGKVDVLQVADGKEQFVTQLTQGQIIGELAILGDITRTAKIVASEHCDLLTLSKKSIENLILSQPQIGLSLIKHIIKSYIQNA